MRRLLSWKRVLATLVVGIGLALLLVFWPQRVDLSHLAAAGDGYSVEILRDTWGVPHVFGQSDADAAFGLAYANAEDDFLTIQQTAIAARGALATVYGIDAAPNDYMVQLLRIWPVVNEQYGSLMPETRALLEGYAAGLNRYASQHPEAVLMESLFPLEGKDIAAASVHKSPLFFGLDGTLGELFEEERAHPVSTRTAAGSVPRFGDIRFGSNAFSIAPSRTDDGSTLLAINSHQPWAGPVSWYEAHVHSEEGWDAAGGLFPGSPVIIHGHNRQLGWAFTVNSTDLADVYVLTINPDNPDQYLFDGQWRDLEVSQASLRVKLVGNLIWPVKRELLWSIYGPTVRTDHGVYAVRYAGFGRADIFEQLYRMNKAANFDEWQQAMRDGGLPTFNVGYADREGNIYYLYNGMIPIRNEGYAWRDYLPGDTSATLWSETLPFDQLPQVLNPPSGFVQNGNSSPFQTTLGAGNPDPGQYPPSLGIETDMSNRALQALALFGTDESISFDEFVRYKFDMGYHPDSDIARFVAQIAAAEAPQEPLLVEAIDHLLAWDLQATPDSRQAALAILMLHQLGLDTVNLVGNEVSTGQLLEALANAAGILRDAYGTIDVPWQEVNRLQRGELSLGLGGGPDVLHAVYGRQTEPGHLVGVAGDSYVMLVRWHPDGQVESHSIHQYGSNVQDPASPHHADQSPLFVQRRLKPVWLDEADIRANLERAYRP